MSQNENVAATFTSNPLLKYTLQGQAKQLEDRAVEQKPLLGSLCLSGQGTVFCAPPNAGKTLITIALLIEAIEQGRIAGGDVFYVDADDTTQGVADKVRLLDEYGVHVIAEGYQGFRASYLAGALEDLVKSETAKGKFLILDTFKKFTQPMSKSDTSRFTEVIRRFVLAGGSLLCLSHTNKHQDANGKNVFAGVSDIIDDLDCAYIIDVRREGEEQVAIFTNKKRRGNVPDTVGYTYSPDPGINYTERLISVRESDKYAALPDDPEGSEPDKYILESIGLTIKHGRDRGKMAIVRMVAGMNNVSKRRVLRLLESRTGDDPERHCWRVVVQAHGRFAYELLDATRVCEA